MKEYSQISGNQPRTLNSRPHALRQASMAMILRTKQRNSISTIKQLQPVIQKKICIGEISKEPEDAGLISKQYNFVKPYLQQWKEMKNIFKKTTESETRKAIEDYFSAEQVVNLTNDVKTTLLYYNDFIKFSNEQELSRQLVQDIKLKLLGFNDMAGLPQQDGQFSSKEDDAAKGRTGKSKILRIYRTMSAEDWKNYLTSKDSKMLFKGHGGSLGQAMYYFFKSKKDNRDDVLVEFEFGDTAQNLIDYTKKQSGGEGKGPEGEKLTGKSEQNDIFELDQDIFSINLSKSKDFLATLNPKIRKLDSVRYR